MTEGAASPTTIDVGRLVLVAEDDRTNQRVILQQLRVLGYAAKIAGSGKEALKMWREGGYALLLTDLHMPEMDGYELIAAIRREESEGRRIPIFALTGSASQAEAERAKAAGINGYLAKPTDLQSLRAVLEKWMPRPAEWTTASAAVEDEAPAVDVTILKGLVGDDANTVREFLADYLVSVRSQATELRAAYMAGDAGRVGDAAHKLKSASRAVGALRLGDLCDGLEDSCRVFNKDVIVRHMAQFETALAAVEKEITRFLARK